MRTEINVRPRRELLEGLPDVRSPEFAAEAHRQSLLAGQSPFEAEDQAFVDSISCWDDLPEYCWDESNDHQEPRP
jgi:Protein  of unknown function (DUF3018)